MTSFDTSTRPSTLAPAAWRALLAVSGAAWSARNAPVAAVALDACTRVTRCVAEQPGWVDPFDPLPSEQADALSVFAQQFSADVSTLGDDALVGLNHTFGPDAFNQVQVVYVQDFLPRALAALGAAFDTTFSVAAEEPENGFVGSSRVDLQACKLEYSIVSPK